MELVFLSDMQLSFASNWQRIANTAGVADIHIGDRFREQGVGPGGEEVEVAGVDISPVHGFSRLFFNRGANATKPEVHRLGAVFEQVGITAKPVDPLYQPLRETVGVTSAIAVSTQPVNLSASAEQSVPLKRGRGRPPGSRNKAKPEVAFPVGF